MTDGSGDGNLVYNTLTTIAVSPINNGIIYTGSDDGNVYVSVDGGNTWENISEGLPKRWITRVAADPLEENVAYVTISGYRWDEYIAHVYKTDDYGQNWIDISSNLPEAPVNDIIISPANTQVIFIATDVGVYFSYDGGSIWEMMGSNLPNVVVTDLVYHQATNKLIAATFGRSMFSYDLEQDPLTHVKGQIDDLNVQVHPNPITDIVSIKWKQDNIQMIYITDINGRIVKDFKNELNPNNHFISWSGISNNGSELPNGVYILVIKSNEGSMSKKLVLK